MMIDHALTARDGRRLAATLFEPTGAPSAAIVLNSATGVPRQFYRRFSTWLAERGFAVLTFDYRGVHGSRIEPLRDDNATIAQWGTYDVAAAIDDIVDRYPSVPSLAIGHSIGGQLIGLADNNMRLMGAVGVATQSGYWRHWPGNDQMARIWRWYVEHPVRARLYGYYPDKRYYGVDLPKGVAIEFARWCRSPAYIVDHRGRPRHDHFEGFERPYRFIGFADDPVAPRPAVQALVKMYSKADRRLDWFQPADLGMPAIGHFDFFRESSRSRLWPQMIDWLASVMPKSEQREQHP